ncbi:MAG: hypothetical protein KC502_20325 [Myxococcales bacterium]|nr:hypothetical protein [Myxococcales bacterium]
MKLGAATAAGLSPDQGPPLLVPIFLFCMAPVSLIAAGGVIATSPTSQWLPAAMTATHIGTLGLLGATMLGALYQMLPVLAGSPAPAIRLGHGVGGLWVVGAVSLCAALWRPEPLRFFVAIAGLGAALGLFLGPVAIALSRAKARAVEVRGMTFAVLALGIVGGLGLTMAYGWATSALPANRAAWVTVHLCVGLLGWVGMLLTAISTQIIPMFYLTAPFPPRIASAAVWLGGVSVLLWTAGLAWGLSATTLAWTAAPFALYVWLIHPIVALKLLAKRRRKRKDVSVQFWQAGSLVAPFVGIAAALTLLSDDPRWPLLFGWLAIFGWGGLIVHGMLTRILPFLVWFHRYAPLVGEMKVPPMRRMFPPSRSGPALIAHLSAVGLGTVAILTGQPVVFAGAGLSLVISGLILAYAMVRLLPGLDADVGPCH